MTLVRYLVFSFLLLQKRIFEAVSEKYNFNDEGIVYDVTNTYFYGKKCELGKLGKDKDGVKGRPLIQVGLGVTQQHGIPVFHKTFHGNIHDSRAFQDMITSFREYGIKKGIIVFDRGISSGQNQIDISEMKYLAVSDKLAHLPWAVKNSIPDKLASKIQSTMVNLSNTSEGKKILKMARVNNFLSANDTDYNQHRDIIKSVLKEEL